MEKSNGLGRDVKMADCRLNVIPSSSEAGEPAAGGST